MFRMVEIIKSAVAALKMWMCMFDFMKLERGKKSLLLSEKVVDYVVHLCLVLWSGSESGQSSPCLGA